MKKHHGFTLIELVIVIVILSVLTAVALPRFVNLEEKATEAVLKGTLSSVKSAARIGNVYARTDAANGTGTVAIDGDDFYMSNGYPVARSSTNGSFSGILGLMEVDPEINISYVGTASNTLSVLASNTIIFYIGNRCISYATPASLGDDPIYSTGVGTYNATTGICS